MTTQIVTDLLKETCGTSSVADAVDGLDDAIALRVDLLLADIHDTHATLSRARNKVITELGEHNPQMLRVGAATRSIALYEEALAAHQAAWARARDVLSVVARLRRQQS